MTLDQFFEGRDESRRIFDSVKHAPDAIGACEMRVTKSQVAFRRKRAFAWAWIPDQYLRGHHAPLVLTLALRRRDPWPRWKQIVEPRPGRFTHHLELRGVSEVDDEVCGRLEEAWAEAA